MKKINPLVYLFFTISLLLSTKELYAMKPITYVLSFQSYNTQCAFSVNGVHAMGNYDDEGPLYAGLNIAAYMENGQNTVTVDMAPLSEVEENHTYSPDAYCQLNMLKRIIQDYTEPDEIELFKLTASINEKLQPTVQQSTKYYNKNKLSPTVEGKLPGSEWYRISQQFAVNDLPEWVWTKATPFEATEENMAKLRQAYLEVWQAMQNKNIPLFKEQNKISFNEKEIAANQPDGAWFYSLDLDVHFENSGGMQSINWDDYKLIILNKGRLVKLEDNDGDSPLMILDKDGDFIGSFNPYFSLIDNKIILTR